MMDDAEPGRAGETFDTFLEEEGLLQVATASAIRRVLAWQLRQTMDRENLGSREMAERLMTSADELERLLDPNDDAVTLATLDRAAKAVGRTLKLELA